MVPIGGNLQKSKSISIIYANWLTSLKGLSLVRFSKVKFIWEAVESGFLATRCQVPKRWRPHHLEWILMFSPHLIFFWPIKRASPPMVGIKLSQVDLSRHWLLTLPQGLLHFGHGHIPMWGKWERGQKLLRGTEEAVLCLGGTIYINVANTRHFYCSLFLKGFQHCQ